jgi:hypothetical protein
MVAAFALSLPSHHFFTPIYWHWLLNPMPLLYRLNTGMATEALTRKLYRFLGRALMAKASHVKGNGSEPWLNNHTDFSRFFMGGDSGEANMSNFLAVKLDHMGYPVRGLLE